MRPGLALCSQRSLLDLSRRELTSSLDRLPIIHHSPRSWRGGGRVRRSLFLFLSFVLSVIPSPVFGEFRAQDAHPPQQVACTGKFMLTGDAQIASLPFGRYALTQPLLLLSIAHIWPPVVKRWRFCCITSSLPHNHAIFSALLSRRYENHVVSSFGSRI